MGLGDIRMFLERVTWDDEVHLRANYQAEVRGGVYTQEQIRESAFKAVRDAFFASPELWAAAGSVWALHGDGNFFGTERNTYTGLSGWVGVQGARSGKSGPVGGASLGSNGVVLHRVRYRQAWRYPSPTGTAIMIPEAVPLAEPHDYETDGVAVRLEGEGRARAVLELLVAEGVL